MTGRITSALLLLILVAAALAACGSKLGDKIEGYAEADYIYVSARVAGTITKLTAREGDHVTQGTPLVSLDTTLETPALQSAVQNLNDAQASALLAQQNYDRTKNLLDSGTRSRADFDQASSALSSANARVLAAKAALATAQQNMADREIAAPVTGSVEEIYHRQGERTAPNEPILAILPPANIKIRFYVPETQLSAIKLGQEITLTCDACKAPISARISFIAREAQYTPPFIYSRDERAKLVYLVEARPGDARDLRPGQPLDVSLAK
ncbi:MAG TPA: efflux RND transporter periplasmic adaptor subunit [Alphaproteobacteria bacterium]|nr:efflux RND transporter periplasmic adaptor subunit [Alphaproteobacteria bacterium]